jgi:hypothetical protein
MVAFDHLAGLYHYVLRIVEPLKADGAVPLVEVRNNAGAATKQP